MVKFVLPSSFSRRFFLALLLFATGLIGISTFVRAQPTGADVRSTVHNLSKNGPGTVKATTETQVCVFCHTPHAANASAKTPLWNRASAPANAYTRYNSLSLDATANGFNDQPGGSSMLCLSCHDGTIALGNVNVLNGLSPAPVVGGLNITMPAGNYGATATSGFTRNLGRDLSNDHPISITYNQALVQLDGDLAGLTTSPPAQRDVATGTLIGIRASGYKPKLPLEPTGSGNAGQVQCATCHDPHLNKSKFLRLNRFQTNAAPAPGASFSETNDQICLACHRKGDSWPKSAHANALVADETYTAAASKLRDFPTPLKKVWEVGCLNCHDTHSAQGSRRLLREGVGTATTVAATGAALGAIFQAGVGTQADNANTSAIENTCFQCHRDAGTVNVLTAAAGSTVPSIKSLMDLTYGMPSATADQAGGKEVHNILNRNLEETQENLGLGAQTNRHAECPDCHNPHRLRRGATFDIESAATGDGALRTHIAGRGAQGNVAAGVLRGGWGVEPTFPPSLPENTWPTVPTGFTIKKGEPAVGSVAPTSRAETDLAPHLTREYQLCFKCHSNYANTEGNYPLLGYAPSGRRGTGLANSNGMLRYTNVAAEFGSVRATDPATSGTDQGEISIDTFNKGTACGGGDCAPRTSTNTGNTGTNYNHRSWHPVMYPTGRDRAERRMAATGSINLRPPFDVNIGKQTMHCSDCHGQESSWTQGSGPTAGTVQGPHGSTRPFLLRGIWNSSTSLSNVNSDTQLCGNCHQPRVSSTGSGYNPGHLADGDMSGLSCMNCHVAVPHGWKNKAFLVNLNCVGTEAGLTGDCNDVGSYGLSYDAAPYYYRAKFFISTWQRSGNWTKSSCGGDSMEDC